MFGGFHREYGQGDTFLELIYAGPQPDYPGLDQINALLPRGLAGAGRSMLKFTSDWIGTSPDGTNQRHTQKTQAVILTFK